MTKVGLLVALTGDGESGTWYMLEFTTDVAAAEEIVAMDEMGLILLAQATRGADIFPDGVALVGRMYVNDDEDEEESDDADGVDPISGLPERLFRPGHAVYSDLFEHPLKDGDDDE